MADESYPAFATTEEKQYQYLPILGKSLTVRVKAAHDCHLCFSPVNEDSDDIFEVFIGGWEGAQSAIRFKKGDDIGKAETPDILNGDEIREFWITFDDDLVRVGRVGEFDPIMEAQLPEHIEVNFFGFSTGWGAVGWFQFPQKQTHNTEDCLTYNYRPIYGNSLTFSVSCPKDAHIALTSAPEDTEVMYEIFLGGWENSNSAIRLNKDKEKTVSKVETPDCCCEDEMRTFWITFKEGHITVGKQGEADPFMEYIDSTPWKVTHFGYCTGWGATGKWLFEV